MRSTLLLVAFVSLIATPVLAEEASTAIVPDHVTPLFNGKDLSGWKADVPARDTNPNAPDSFVVRDGMLVSNGKPEGHLVSTAAYRDYRLEVEYRFPGKGGNCGVLVHASKPRALYKMFPQSIEVQMMSGDAGDFWCIQEDIKVPDMEKRRPRKPNEKWGGAEGDARRILNLTDGSEKPLGAVEHDGDRGPRPIPQGLGQRRPRERRLRRHGRPRPDRAPGRGHRGRVPQGRDRPASGSGEVAVFPRRRPQPRQWVEVRLGERIRVYSRTNRRKRTLTRLTEEGR